MGEQERQQAAGQNEPKLLYHYTDQKGLLGILGEKSKAIWATSIRYLNDTSEGQIILRVVLDEISSRYDSGDLFRQLGIANDKTINKSESADAEALTKAIEMAAWATSLNVFVTSFSEKGNSLSQWRAYSGESGGYSIGFRPAYLRGIGDHFLRGRTEVFSSSDALIKCTYLDEREKGVLEHEIQEIVSAYIKEAKPSTGPPTKREKEGFNSQSALAMKHFIPLGKRYAAFKDAGFSEEAEWRLAILHNPNCLPADLKISSGSSMPVPYLEIDLAPVKDIIGIDEIYVGPCPYPSEAVRAVEILLNQRGFKGVQVKYSQIPYRDC
jgi:hypothetical protein